MIDLAPVRIIPVVIGIIKQQENFLIAKRPPHVVMPGYWEFPGGKVEAEETQFAALVRELREEIAIEVKAAKFLTQIQRHSANRLVELNVWHVEHYEYEPQGNEGQDIRWVSAQQFVDYEFLPSNQELLQFLTDWR